MALDGWIKNELQGGLTLIDGTGSPVSLVVPFWDGTFSLSEIADVLNEEEAYESRGQLVGLNWGNRIFPTFSFSAMVAEFTNASPGVLSDFILKRGAYASNVSTQGAGRPYTINVKFDLEGSNHGGNDSTFTLGSCRCRVAIDVTRPIKFNVTGTVYGAITGDLAVAQVSIP